MRVIRFAVVVSLLLLVSLSVGSAQGRRGEGPLGGFAMLSAEPVQAELKMTPSQIAKVPVKQKEVEDQIRDLMQSALNGDRSATFLEAFRAKMLAIPHDAVAAILDGAQMKRFEELDLQHSGPAALLRPDIVARLNISADQLKQLTAIRRASTRAIREAARGRESQSGAGADQTGISDQEKQSDAKMLAVLTADQQSQWQAMQGEPMPFVQQMPVRRVDIRPLLPTLPGRGNALDRHDAGSTPLMRAASAGDIDEVKSLIAANNDVNAKNKEGWTALMLAALNGKKDCFDCLIAAHADANAKDKKGNTVLMAAAQGGDVECVKSVAASGADIKAANSGGMSALMWAAQNGRGAVVNYLLAAGAGVNAKNKDGETPLVKAMCVTWDQSRSPSPGVQVPGYTNLNPAGSIASNQAATASQIGAIGAVAGQLLANSLFAAPMVKYPVGWGAGDVVTVKALIAAGADVNCKDALYHMTPLIGAAMRGNTECVQALIAAGADVSAKDSMGRTALICAAVSGVTDCVKGLITAHADVNAKDTGGRTALLNAVDGDYPDSVAALVAAGADVNAKDRRGKTARTLAKSDAVRSILQAAESKP